MIRTLPNISPETDIALDFETRDPLLKTKGMPGWVHNEGHICGICVATAEEEWYIPIGHKEGFNFDQDEALTWLKTLLSGNSTKVFHNAHYDMGWLKMYNIPVKGNVVDTMLAAPLLNEHQQRYSLDVCAKIELGVRKDEFLLEQEIRARYSEIKKEKTNYSFNLYKEFKNGKIKKTIKEDVSEEKFLELQDKVKQDAYQVITNVATNTEVTYEKMKAGDLKSHLWKLPYEYVESYGKQDARLTYDLWFKKYKKRIKEDKLERVFKLEHDLIPVFIDVRLKGIRVDLVKAKELDIKYTDIIERNAAKMNDLAGFEGSGTDKTYTPTDLIKICEKFDLEYAKTGLGNASFKADLLPEHEFFDYLKIVKKYSKARNEFLRIHIMGNQVNGRIHTQFNQLKSDDGGTVTGRLSSSNPNLQNIPARGDIGDDMRSLFIPDEGKELLVMDFSGQEPRMLVNLVLKYAQVYGDNAIKGSDLAMEDRFRGRDSDFHTEVSATCMINKHRQPRELIKDIIAKFRKNAKAIGLGIMYGRGVDSVATALGVPFKEAYDVKEEVLEAVPFLKPISDIAINAAKTNGYVMTLLGRRGRFSDWEFNDKGQPDEFGKFKWADRTPHVFKTKAAAEAKCKELRDKGRNVSWVQRADTYKALNKIIQGSSADQTKMAMLKIYTRNQDVNPFDLLFRQLDFEPVILHLQVHDELIFSITEDEDIDWYQKTMENCIELLVESKAEPGLGKNWKEAKEDAETKLSRYYQKGFHCVS